MLEIYNKDLTFKINLGKQHVINFNHIQSIDFNFYTKDIKITKGLKDVDKYNYITLSWYELSQLGDGLLMYDYNILTTSNEMLKGNTVVTNYWIGEIDKTVTVNVDKGNGSNVDLSDYYNKEEINRLLDNVVLGEIDLSNYYTREQVDDLIQSIDIPTGGTSNVDLTDYYTKSEVDKKIPTDYITSIPSEYVTETELNAKGYLTQHQSLDEYAKLTDIPTDYATKEHTHSQYLTEHQSLEEYAKLSDIPTPYDDTALNNKITSIETSLGDIATIIDVINGEVI